jgi:beta-mannanase
MKLKRILSGAVPVAVLAIGGAAMGKLPFLPVDLSVSRAFAAVVSYVGKIPAVNRPGIVLGAYDPHGDFKELDGVKIEHVFLPWQDVDLTSLSDADAYAQSRGRDLLVTVEPWSWSREWRMTSGQLRAAIASGQYDANIANVCSAAGKLRSSVTIRWAHEMDDKSGQFTWSRWAPADYISAYRKFVNECRTWAPMAKFMWSPKGESNMNEYYPGDSFVDVVGLSVFGLQQYDQDKFGHSRTFAETIAPAYKLASIHERPIIVAELGYAGDASYVQQWAASVTHKDPAFPQLTAVVYFNDKEVYPWPRPYGLPDWRVAGPEATN